MARTAAEYRFAGDIKKAAGGTRLFNLKDRLNLRFDVPADLDPEQLALVFEIRELRLSTTDIEGTDGFSRVEFAAVQDGTTLWRWGARVAQGQRPRIDGTLATPDAAVRLERDMLVVRGVEIPTKLLDAPGNEPTSVEFIMRVEGQGERL